MCVGEQTAVTWQICMNLVPVFLGDLVTMCACYAHVWWFLCGYHWYACLILVFTWESGGEPSTFPLGELREQKLLTQTCL